MVRRCVRLAVLVAVLAAPAAASAGANPPAGARILGVGVDLTPDAPGAEALERLLQPDPCAADGISFLDLARFSRALIGLGVRDPRVLGGDLYVLYALAVFRDTASLPWDDGSTSGFFLLGRCEGAGLVVAPRAGSA